MRGSYGLMQRDGLGALWWGMFVFDKWGYCLGLLSLDRSFEGSARC